jgi:hypothetical protein
MDFTFPRLISDLGVLSARRRGLGRNAGECVLFLKSAKIEAYFIMTKIKDIPKIDRPRERFLKKGSEALSKSDLLAILLGSGIKGKN